jgi:HlyD family secretion protein
MSMDRAITKKKWTTRRIIAWSAAALFVIVMTALLLSSGGSSLNVEKERLSIFSVRRGPFQEYIPVIGTVQPRSTIFLTAVEGGRVEKIFIEAGSKVKQGDKIVQLSNTSLLLDIMYREANFVQQVNNLNTTKLQLEQNRLSLNSQVEQVQSDYDKAKKRFERVAAIRKEGFNSEQDYEDAQRDLELSTKKRDLTVETRNSNVKFQEEQIRQLEISLKQMRDNLVVAKEKLNNLTICAPETGLLSSLQVEIGESKAPGIRIGQLDILDGHKIRAAIDEHYIARIAAGRQARFEYDGKNYRLEIRRVFPEVKEGRFEVDFDFKDPEPKGINRGQSLHVNLELSELSEATLLECGGFYQKTGGNWVYVLDASGSAASKRAIHLGRKNSDYYEVLDGLKAGDRVITSSYDNFGDNERLNLK